jgi:hypothetical protein
MKRNLLLTLLLTTAAAILLTGCMVGGRTLIRGEGPRMTYTLDVTGFTGLRIEGAHDLTFRQSDNFSVVVEMQENIYELLEAEVKGGVLDISYTRSFTTAWGQTPKLTIYAPALDMLYVAGAVNADMELDADSLNIHISGAASVTMRGTAQTLDISAAGAANVNAFDMKAVTVTVNVAGTGSIDVYASGTLYVSVAGVGRVRYDGDAVLTRNVAGVGTVTRR